MFYYKFELKIDGSEVLINMTSVEEAYVMEMKLGEFIDSVECEDFGQKLFDLIGWIPDVDSVFWDDFFNFYNSILEGEGAQTKLEEAIRANQDLKEKSGPFKRMLIGLARPSVVPQALIKHRVSPFADSERAWDYVSLTRPVLDEIKSKGDSERRKLHSYQVAQIAKLKATAVVKSDFLGMLIVNGITPARLKARFYINLFLAFFFAFIISLQAFMAYLRLTDQAKEILPFVDKVFWLFGYTSWVMMAIVVISSAIMMMIRLWFCKLINIRKLENEYLFRSFLFSFQWWPGLFRPIKLKRN